MLEVPDKPIAVPPPLPVAPYEARTEGAIVGTDSPPPPPPPESTDKVAVASTVCSLTAFVPIVSQVVGLILGFWALRRIGRSRQAGLRVNGRGWAAAGITGNGLVLLGWLALFGAFMFLKGTLHDATVKLHPLLKKPAVVRPQVP